MVLLKDIYATKYKCNRFNKSVDIKWSGVEAHVGWIQVEST